MKLLLYSLVLLITFSCNQKKTSSKNTISTVSKAQKEYPSIRNSTDIYFDSFAYAFIKKITPIDTNDILIESLLKFEKTFINFIPRKKSPKDENVLYIVDFPFGTGPVATYKKNDSSSVKEQITNAEGMHWSVYRLQHPKTLNNYYKWIEKNPKFEWEVFKAAGFGCFITLSAPIFNQLKNKAVIVIGRQCHNTLGAGYVYLFELNKNGNWEMTKNRELWIS
jgi:hypothetical protein